MDETARCILAELRKDAEKAMRLAPWRDWVKRPIACLRCLLSGHTLRLLHRKRVEREFMFVQSGPLEAERFTYRCRCGMRALLDVSPELLQDSA